MKTVKGTRKELTGTNHKTFKKKCKNKENNVIYPCQDIETTALKKIMLVNQTLSFSKMRKNEKSDDRKMYSVQASKLSITYTSVFVNLNKPRLSQSSKVAKQ